MIEARQFVEAARERGFDWWAGVPCSFLTPFINYVLQDPSLRYVSMANEGDAIALIAGVTLGGRRGVSMMQNSGLGNAVSPLTSLTWTFRLGETAGDGPRFARLFTRPGSPEGLPRPSVTPIDVRTRLMQHFGPCRLQAPCGLQASPAGVT